MRLLWEIKKREKAQLFCLFQSLQCQGCFHADTGPGLFLLSPWAGRWTEERRKCGCKMSFRSLWPPVLTDPPAGLSWNTSGAPSRQKMLIFRIKFIISATWSTHWEICALEVTFACGGFVSSDSSFRPLCSRCNLPFHPLSCQLVNFLPWGSLL